MHQPTLFIVLICFFPWTVPGKIFHTHLGTKCIEECRLYGSEYKCKTITEEGTSDLLYCSPRKSQDYRGNECRSPCQKAGEGYYWCKVGWTWQYCGDVKEERGGSNSGSAGNSPSPSFDAAYKQVPGLLDHFRGIKYNHHRNRRANDEIIFNREPYDSNREIVFSACPTCQAIADGSQWRKEINNLLNDWGRVSLPDRAKSELLKSKNFRIDLQGLIKRHNLYYYNLQIQMNVPRQSGKSTTVSQVFLPQKENIPDNHAIYAFVQSLDRRARVFVDVMKLDKSGKVKG